MESRPSGGSHLLCDHFLCDHLFCDHQISKKGLIKPFRGRDRLSSQSVGIEGWRGGHNWSYAPPPEVCWTSDPSLSSRATVSFRITYCILSVATLRAPQRSSRCCSSTESQHNDRDCGPQAKVLCAPARCLRISAQSCWLTIFHF